MERQTEKMFQSKFEQLKICQVILFRSSLSHGTDRKIGVGCIHFFRGYRGVYNFHRSKDIGKSPQYITVGIGQLGDGEDSRKSSK